MRGRQWVKSEQKLPRVVRCVTLCIVDNVVHLFGGSSGGERQAWHMPLTAGQGVSKNLPKLTQQMCDDPQVP